MKICFVAWSDFGIGGVPRVLTCLMDALSRKPDVSLYSLKNLPQSGIQGIDREQIHIYCREMNLYEKIRRSAADVLVCNPSVQLRPRLSAMRGRALHVRLQKGADESSQ